MTTSPSFLADDSRPSAEPSRSRAARASTRPRIVIGNLSAPEIDRLATAACMAGCLDRYVRRYVNRGRWAERLLEQAPGLGNVHRRTLGRRRLPPGLDPAHVIEAGVGMDWAFALASRLPVPLQRGLKARMQRLLADTEKAISCRLAHEVPGATHVVASYGTALEAFLAGKGSGARCVLNYPIAHHQYQFDFYAEERELNPGFAAMLPTFDWPPGYQARLEEEIQRADRILVGSRFARESFLKQGVPGDHVFAEPYGVDTSRFGPPSGRRNDGIFRVLYVGQLGQRKGISYLLDAYEQFRGPATELLMVGGLVGNPAPLEPYRDLYRYRPFVPQSELPSVYHSADVFVFPTLIEGMGLVAVEALACGLPVICTDRGPDDIVRDGIEGFVVPIRDPQAIAEKLELLHRDPGLRQRMSAAAIERAATFTWARYCAGALAVVLGHEPA